MILKNHRNITIHHNLTKGNIPIFHRSPDHAVRMSWIQKARRIHGEDGFLLPEAVQLFVFFLCLILASVQKVIRMLRDCLSSSLAIHFISLQLPLERQKVKTSRWLSVLQPDCFFFFFFSVFCTAGSFQVIAALVNLPVLIYRCLLGFCLLFLISYFCGLKRNARSWNWFSLSPYRHI